MQYCPSKRQCSAEVVVDLVHCQRYHVTGRMRCESQIARFALGLLATRGGAQVGETVFWHLHLPISG